MNGTDPKDGEKAHARARRTATARSWPITVKDRYDSLPPTDRPWFWWQKVALELDARRMSIAELSRRTGIPSSNLKRWIRAMTDEEMMTHGPSNEITICVRVAEALDWSVFYTMLPSMPWPPPDGCTRWGRSMRSLAATIMPLEEWRRRGILSVTMNATAEILERVVRTVVESEAGVVRAVEKVRTILGEAGGQGKGGER